MSLNNHRLIYLVILVVIICFGLYSKRITGRITEIIDLKDVMWSMAVYFIFRLLLIDWSTIKIALIGLIFSYLIEVSQLYHSDWIDSLRRTSLGELTLGSTFLWSDLLAYSFGIVIGLIIDYFLIYYLSSKRIPWIHNRWNVIQAHRCLHIKHKIFC